MKAGEKRLLCDSRSSLQESSTEGEDDDIRVHLPRASNYRISTNVSQEIRKPNPQMKYIKKHAWKITFFVLVFFTLVFLNILFAPMMIQCSEMLIEKIEQNLSNAFTIYCRVGIALGSAELYIVVIAIIGIFVSR